jgi:hypothetical protein
MLKRRGERQVLLEAVAATPLMHELALEILLGKRYWNPAMRIEVLEWDRGRVCAVDGLQRRALAGAQPDAPKVGGEIQHPAERITSGTRH